MDAKKAAEFRLGIIVLVVLAVLTGAEYGISFTPALWLALIVIALIKAGIVIQYFMHIKRIVAEDGGH
ncbi:MAG: cytochrome C oxidase subunit IV family protein [Chloroflexi bacterium]|nr:cytochrome C oxidase subunit IV family protein [Chloroflexota bacterium]MBI5713581.1 cytochrome C oxidase subunit IV family protein [Chloroflexota bacterium]